jgi:LysM repeat protein
MKIMSGMKRGALVASTLMLVAILLSACNQPYSQAPVVTNTPINPNSLFATPVGQGTELSPVEMFASQTAQAANPGTPVGATPTGGVTATSTPFVSLPATATFISTSTLAVPAGVSTSTPGASGTNLQRYVLQQEEFPYCIARRLGVNPQALLDASGLASPDIYYAGLELKIPQGPGVAWSEAELGPRALRSHPAPYVVTGNADTTVYGVACKFGTADPGLIAQQNGISTGATLTVGQTLNVP